MFTMIPRRAALLAAAGLALNACSDTSSADLVEVDFRMQRTGAGVMPQVTAGWFADLVGTAAPVPVDTIAALTVTIDSIQALPVAADDADTAWATVVLSAPVTLDLLALPTTGASPLVVTSGTLPAGDYRKVRLFVTSAEIEFKGPIMVGQTLFDAAVAHPVTVPSGAQTGIKTDITFTASDAADVDLLFDQTATFTNVSATGSGRVMLAPVIRAR